MASSSSSCAVEALRSRLACGRRLCDRLRHGINPPAPRLRHRALRPRKHDASRLVDRERRLSLGHRRPRRADLPTRVALRSDPGRVGSALVGLAGSRAPARRPGGRRGCRRDPGLLARAQASRCGVAGCRPRRRLPRLSAGAMADHERLPSGRARLSAPPLRVVASRRATPLGLRAPGRGGDRNEGARRPRRRGDGRLVRRPLPLAAHRSDHRCPGRRGGARRDVRRHTPLRAGRILRVREPLRLSHARRPRSDVPRLAPLPTRIPAADRAARAARRRARARRSICSPRRSPRPP